MLTEKFYIINQHMMFMEGQFDENGRLCSKVTEENRTLLVERSPLQILEDSIKCIGYDLRGARATAKWILGDINMCPVMVNPIQGICVFPDRSPKHENTIWFNPYHIVRTTSHLRKTRIEFSNGQMLEIQLKLSSFNHKLQSAEQLRKITVEIGKNPITLILEPHKRRTKSNSKHKTHI